MTKSKMIPEKQYYHNIVSKKKFKDTLDFFLANESADVPANDKLLMEKLLIGTLAAVELDCIADLKNNVLNLSKTKKHYLDYAKIAKRSKLDREDIQEFICRIEKHCL